MKDLGEFGYFLGLEVLKHDSSIILSQQKYATELLVKVGLQDCKPSFSPSSVKLVVVFPDAQFEDQHWYKTIVGSLQYLTLTRPEISFAVYLACQHMHNPKKSHFIVVKRILRYVMGTLLHGLQFVPGPLTLTTYSDVD